MALEVKDRGDCKGGLFELAASLDNWSHPVLLVDSMDSRIYLNGPAKCALKSGATGLGNGRAEREMFLSVLGECVADVDDGPSEITLDGGPLTRWLASVIRRADGQRVGMMLSAM